MNIQAIIDDWKAGLTLGELKSEHGLTHNQASAITWCVDYGHIDPRPNRLRALRPEMKAREIIDVMRGG